MDSLTECVVNCQGVDMATTVDKPTKVIPVRLRCTVRRCVNKRAVLQLPDGRKGRAKVCHSHLSPKLRQYDIAVTHTTTARQGTTDNVKATCGALTKGSVSRGRPGGGACTRPAGWGTSHVGYGTCKLHGGSTPNMAIQAAKAEATENAVIMGLPIEVDPTDALLHCVYVSAGQEQYCRMRVQMLKESELTPVFREREYGEGEKGSLDKRKVNNQADLNIWIRTHASALERLAKFSKMALDAGVAERQVRVAETMGTQIGKLIQGILTDLQLTKGQWKSAPDVVQKHLAVIESVASNG